MITLKCLIIVSLSFGLFCVFDLCIGSRCYSDSPLKPIICHFLKVSTKPRDTADPASSFY